MPKPLLSFVAASSCIALAWCVVLPRLAQQPVVAKRLKFLDDRNIDASALYYTDLEAMEPILDRLEGRHRSAIAAVGQPRREQDSAIMLVSTRVRKYPPGKLGETVRAGEEMVSHTSSHPLTKPFVGNTLNCTSCHLDARTHPQAASFIGVASAYPAYAPREGKVITLEDRILNCFIRSQNGKRPPNGSVVSTAIAAYITWLSEGTPIAMNASASLGPNRLKTLKTPETKPDHVRGEKLYADRCGDCHSPDGSGTDSGPPVWGDESFNDGAGLSKIGKMASWLKVAMPLDDTDLTDEECYDLAVYLTSKPRPKFQGK